MVKIFLVEDNEMNWDMLFRCLVCKKFEVVIVVDGVEGVEMFILKVLNIIIMDMSLFELDGWEVIRRIKVNF